MVGLRYLQLCWTAASVCVPLRAAAVFRDKFMFWDFGSLFLPCNDPTASITEAQIPVTDSVDASGYETCFLSWTSKVNFRLFRLPAGGCRFGSGPGRSWCRCRSLWFCFFSVGSNHGRAWAPTQEPAVIRRSLDGSSLAVSVAIQGVSY